MTAPNKSPKLTLESVVALRGIVRGSAAWLKRQEPMKHPPISLSYPSYVIEFAVVDETVEYMNRKNLNVGGEWLEAVPKLAICYDIEREEYFLAHCDEGWEVLCLVESHKTIAESKINAEKHYRGLNAKWIKTNYKKSEAIKLFEEEKESMKCSFCGRSHYDHEFSELIAGDAAKICNLCVEKFSQELEDDGS